MVETKDLVKWGVVALGGVSAAAIVMLGLIAWAHDGEVANQIVTALLNVLQLSVPGLTILVGVNQVGSAFVSVKQVGAQAQNQSSFNGSTPTPAPVAAPQPEPVPVAVGAGAGVIGSGV